LQPGLLEWKFSHMCYNNTTIRSGVHKRDTINNIPKCATLYMFQGQQTPYIWREVHGFFVYDYKSRLGSHSVPASNRNWQQMFSS
jgi:hypothetical protein